MNRRKRKIELIDSKEENVNTNIKKEQTESFQLVEKTEVKSEIKRRPKW